MQKMICRLCNHRYRRVPFERLLTPHFGEDAWFFFTLSFKGCSDIEFVYSANFAGEWAEASGPTEINDLNSFDLDGGFYLHEVRNHLEAGAEALRLIIRKGILLSALLVFELAFKFLPLQVLPHCHGLLCSRDSGEFLAEVLAEAMATYLCRCQHLYIRLSPSVQVYKLKTPDEFLRTIRYSIKAIDLVSPYQTAYLRAKNEKRVFELSRQVDEVLDAFEEVTGGLRKIRAYGKLNGRFSEAYCR